MSVFPYPAWSSPNPMRLLVFGFCAMLIHLLFGGGLLRVLHQAGPEFISGVCSGHLTIAPGTGDLPQGKQDCCKLCVAGAPIPATPVIAVAPAPTPLGRSERFHSATPGLAYAFAHRPRGPP